MPRILRRETFIALRARRQAYQIASDVLNPHVEVTSIPCPNCGRDVPIPPPPGLPPDLRRVPDPTRWWMYTPRPLPPRPRTRCPSCGADAPLPSTALVDVDAPPEPIDYNAREPIRPLSSWEWIWIFVILAILFLIVHAVVSDWPGA